MSWFKALFGKPAQERAAVHEQETFPDVNMIAEDDPRIAEGQARVVTHWAGVGQRETDVLSYIVNPQFMGAPAWPNMRQAFAVIRTGSSLILASDGLSDPFVGSDMDQQSGFGLEVFIEIEGKQDAAFDEIMAMPEFRMIEMVARNVAGHGGIAELIDRLGTLSMALPLDGGFIDGWEDAEGQVGVLLGLEAATVPARIDLPFGPVRFIAVTPLRPEETVLTARSGEGRTRVAEALARSPSGHRFVHERAAVL